MSAVLQSDPKSATLFSRMLSNVFRPLRHPTSAMNASRPHSWLVRRLASWRLKRDSRRALLHLTDAELLDIGVTRGEARKEAGRSFFWD
jgi:uncharacterized protein YjiS (DUF1127 family)